jgi:predicted ATPase/DNA-binding SARP family transcriptional activator
VLVTTLAVAPGRRGGQDLGMPTPRPRAQQAVEVRLLGVLEVVDADGAVVPINGLKLRTLLAALALDAGRPVSIDRLVDCLYGEQLPVQADNALQAQVSTLRRALRGPEGLGISIANQGRGYVLGIEPAKVDALRFSALVADGRARARRGQWGEASALLREALSLWRGPALADFTDCEFASGERVRLEELRLSATEDCVEADLELGRHVEWVADLEQLLLVHPLRERLWGLLMTALYRSGRQAEALRAFQQARRHLGEQLGIEPGPDLCRLEASILAQAPELSRPPSTTTATAAATAGVAPAPASTGNLVRPLAACLGRAAELGAIHELLGSHRLVTLVGPGGTGKTRLAVEVGHTRHADAEGGVWMVDLASVSDPDGVVLALRSALAPLLGPGVAPDSGPAAASSGVAGVAGAIGDRNPLVVLDNCEHVIGEAADLAAELVSACPRLRILATSREGLGVPGEVLFPVAPLDHAAAVCLFVERATAVQPALHLDEAATAAVSDICTRLDGLPLAIELAAARTRALDVRQIAGRLNDRFQLLTTGPRTARPRQRTLRAVIDWSYDLLEPAERLLFERLSVFPGGATLASVEAVCAGDGIEAVDVADVLSRLIDKSLVFVQRQAEGHRYAMLQSLAEYAADRLATSGQADVARRNHAAWVLTLVRGAERGCGPVATVTLAELDAEMASLDAALAWAGAHDPSLALELAGRLGWFWFWTGRMESGWTHLSLALDRPSTVADAVRARATAWAGLLGAVVQVPGTGALVEAAVEQGRTCGDPSSLANVLTIRAALTILQGAVQPALVDLVEAGEIYAASGDHHGRGMVALLHGMAATRDGRVGDAGASYEESARHFIAAGDHWAAGVAGQRLAELDEPGDRPDPETPAAATSDAEAPVAFYRALIRAQMSSARSTAPGTGSAVGGGRSAAADPHGTDAMAVAVADHIRGREALRQHRTTEARAHLEAALDRYRALGQEVAACICLGDVGRAAATAGDPEVAVRCHAEAAATAFRVGDGPLLVSALEALAAVLVGHGEGERAAWALGAADALRDAGAEPWDADVDDRTTAEAAAAAQLGEDALGELRRGGRTMRVDDVLAGLLA